jgi:hypothetical protein
MASAWGKSWGKAWGNAWGLLETLRKRFPRSGSASVSVRPQITAQARTAPPVSERVQVEFERPAMNPDSRPAEIETQRNNAQETQRNEPEVNHRA